LATFTIVFHWSRSCDFGLQFLTWYFNLIIPRKNTTTAIFCRQDDNIKIDLVEIRCENCLDSSDPWWDLLKFFCVHDNESSDSVKSGQFLEKMNDYQLLNDDAAFTQLMRQMNWGATERTALAANTQASSWKLQTEL
jgi:hypothetical protein